MTEKDKPPSKLSKPDQEIWDDYNRDLIKTEPDEKEVFAEMFTNMEGAPRPDILEGEITKESDPDTFKKPQSHFSSNEMDKNTLDRLRKGKIPVEARLDLHGMSKVTAYEAVMHFIQKSFQNKKRCVLIITGKGKSKRTSDEWAKPDGGVLKTSLPAWLKENICRDVVLKHARAADKDGGGGAFYIYLRRNK